MLGITDQDREPLIDPTKQSTPMDTDEEEVEEQDFSKLTAQQAKMRKDDNEVRGWEGN